MKWLSSAEIRRELNISPQALYALRKKVISDVQLMGLRDRGDVVSPLHLEIR